MLFRSLNLGSNLNFSQKIWNLETANDRPRKSQRVWPCSPIRRHVNRAQVPRSLLNGDDGLLAAPPSFIHALTTLNDYLISQARYLLSFRVVVSVVTHRVTPTASCCSAQKLSVPYLDGICPVGVLTSNGELAKSKFRPITNYLFCS